MLSVALQIESYSRNAIINFLLQLIKLAKLKEKKRLSWIYLIYASLDFFFDGRN